MPIGLTVVLWFLYLLVGLILSVPYTFLAGWDAGDLFPTAFFTPMAALVLFIAYKLRGIGRRDSKRPKWGGGAFWLLTAYVSLPILLNGASLVLKTMGFEAASQLLFGIRYFSLLAVPMVLIVLLMVYGGVANIVRSIRQRFSSGPPPANTPPNGGVGLNTSAMVGAGDDRTDSLGTARFSSV